MKRRAAVAVAFVAVLAMPVPASAQIGRIRQHRKPAPTTYCQLLARAAVDPGAQTLTVIDQAGVTAEDLCHVELAVQQQASQLRAAWGTPPIRFAAGGWLIYLQTGAVFHPDGSESMQLGGYHDWNGQQPGAVVTTGGLPYQGWAYALSHEVVEMLVDPMTGQLRGTSLLEVADPVEHLTYQLDNVPVSDFVLPAYFDSTQAGPWDEMNTHQILMNTLTTVYGCMLLCEPPPPADGVLPLTVALDPEVAVHDPPEPR